MENLEEYLRPDEYDAENGSFAPAGPFYESLAREVSGPVLELACGTGRIAIPMAALGWLRSGAMARRLGPEPGDGREPRDDLHLSSAGRT